MYQFYSAIAHARIIFLHKTTKLLSIYLGNIQGDDIRINTNQKLTKKKKSTNIIAFFPTNFNVHNYEMYDRLDGYK